MTATGTTGTPTMTPTEPTTGPETERTAHRTGADSVWQIDPGLAEGWSKLLLFVGLGGLAVGSTVNVGAVVWAGAAAIGVAFAANTVGKLSYYGELPISAADRLTLSASWVSLAATVVGLLWTYATARYGSSEAAFFWPLAVAGAGFGLVHVAVQGRYLPADGDPDQ